MRLRSSIAAGALAFCLMVSPIAWAQTDLPQEDVLGYLEQLVQWQRDAASIETSINNPRELIFQDTLQQNALKALRSGFKFARQQATTDHTAEETPAEGEEMTPRQRMLQRSAETDRMVTQLRTKLAARNLTGSQRQVLEDSLKLALAKQELFQAVVVNMNASSSNSAKDMAGKINNLAREIPELNSENAKTTKAKPAEVAAVPPAAVTRSATSILSLADDLFSITRKQRELKEFLAQTTQLKTASRDLIKSLRDALDNITGSDSAHTPIDTQVATFKQIGAVIIPLGDATLWISASETTIGDWQALLEQRFQVLLRQLLLKLALLGFTLAIPLALGEVARRAIGRYVTDPKRRRQANTARRIMVGIIVLFILLLNFISDFSSFATFAGFMTAGLAVALQSVLLSLVAHFFFYGRYGVRPGDRVNVAGVTGDILQIGIIRFYLRELATDEKGALVSTGKTVAFPNSILFQPTAFYKYVS